MTTQEQADFNLQILPELLRGHKMSDTVAIIGSTDIVLGCVDR
jgi:NADH-quinone oxidoreductase subunit D